MNPAHWGNRRVTWQYIPAPNYTGDIEIAFIQGAQVWWPAIVVNHLANGIHGVDSFVNGAWVKSSMNGDMGQSYIISPTTTGGSTYQIRVYDVNDQLINGGRIYNFTFPSAACGSQCSGAYNEVVYTIQ
jgi:expansin (peptidoglycan-binding protein)